MEWWATGSYRSSIRRLRCSPVYPIYADQKAMASGSNCQSHTLLISSEIFTCIVDKYLHWLYLFLFHASRSYSYWSGPVLRLRISCSSNLMKKSVSSGFATHKIEQQSLTALSLPLWVNRSPTCKTCGSWFTSGMKWIKKKCYIFKGLLLSSS